MANIPSSIFSSVNGGVTLAASQTFSATYGVGGFSNAGVNINTTQTILSLSGRRLIKALLITGLGTSGTLALTITIDGRTIFNGNVTITADTLPIFATFTGQTSGDIKVDSSVVITAQKSSTTAVVQGIIYSEL